MADELKDKRVAFLFTEGAEQVEVTEPLKAVKNAGADTEIVSLETGEVEMWNHFDKGDKIKVDRAVKDATRPLSTRWSYRASGSTGKWWSTTGW